MPQRDATLFQPVIQRGKIGKVRHALQHLMTGVADVLLDLTFLPPRRWIAKVWLEDIVVRHREEADIDLPRLAAAHEINRRLHVVIDTALRHAAEHPERMPMGVEQHLVGLQGIGPQKEGPAVRQLDMADLELYALAADNRKILAPVELERLPGAESQGDEGAAPRCLFVALTIGAPLPCKGRHTVVGTSKAKSDEIGMHLLQRVPIFASLLRIGLEPARQRLGKWIKLARPFRRRELWLDHISLQILLDGIARHTGAALNLPDRQTLTQA